MVATADLPQVLVIDDEMGPRESLRMLLKPIYQVHTADSVEIGLKLLNEKKPDAIVMDIRMPGITGIEGLRRIRQIDPHLSVIMLTGFGALETAKEALRLGARLLVSGRRALAQLVNAAVDIGAIHLVKLTDGIDHRERFLRGGGAIEIDQRLAVDCLLEDREVLANPLHVERRRNLATEAAH